MASTAYIVPITMFSILYNLPKFWELRVARNIKNLPNVTNISDSSFLSESVQFDYENISSLETDFDKTLSPEFGIFPTDMRQNPLYVKIYLIYMNLIIHGIIPIITLF